MHNHQRSSAKAKPAYSSESLLFRSVIGILLIALGIIAGIALLAPASGSALSTVKQALYGIGGLPCFALPVFLIWAGVLTAFSTRRRVSVRAILLLFVCFLCACGIINLTTKVNLNADTVNLVDYVKTLNADGGETNADGYWPMLRRCYQLCARKTAGGGFLGMAIAWPLWRYISGVGAIIILALIAVTCIMFVSKFDIVGWGREAKKRSDQKMEQREQERVEREYVQQQAAAVQPTEPDEEPKKSIFSKLFRRDEPDEEPAPVQPTMQQGPYGMPNANQLAMQQAQLAFLQQQMFMRQIQQQQAMQAAAQAPAPEPQEPHAAPIPPLQGKSVDLYDEEIYSEEELAKAGDWRRGGATKRKSKKNAQPTATEAPVVAQGEAPIDFPWKTQPPVAPAKRGKPKSKEDAEYEDMRRRKDELEKELFGAEQAKAQSAAAVTPAPDADPRERIPKEEAYQAYKRPVSIPQPTAQTQIPMSGKRLDVPELILPDNKKENTDAPKPTPKPYVYPTLDLLTTPRLVQQDTRELDAENAVKLEKTLQSFDVPARVQRVTHGPAVTRFELGLASSGINVKRIVNIADNIALDMAANGGVRIEVPIPGTNLFGIEIPNKEISSVSLAEVLTSPEMAANTSPLAVALGKDIAGKPIICDLAKMPHLLIAGQTGSGKSVCINAIINSILFRAKPEQVRMIMIDPKVVELQCYNVIPHLLIPVVSDPHKAAGALAWAVAEMLDRYQRIKNKNVRDISGYNKKLSPDEEPMPRIVIIVDELSDLMLACKREVEESIIRLAQLARAAGIHLVIATQRPTVNVITGLIKANVPSRIAFAVASNTDSRTILDANGADKLLGKGDMFYYPTGASAPMRVQGCFLSDAEIERVTDYIASHTEPDFDPNILEVMESEGESAAKPEESGDDEGVDDRLREAIDMVVMDGQASISMLQRRMKIGYARAGRLIDDMAARGIVSKSVGSKPREILITREEYERIKDAL